MKRLLLLALLLAIAPYALAEDASKTKVNSVMNALSKLDTAMRTAMDTHTADMLELCSLMADAEDSLAKLSLPNLDEEIDNMHSGVMNDQVKYCRPASVFNARNIKYDNRYHYMIEQLIEALGA